MSDGTYRTEMAWADVRPSSDILTNLNNEGELKRGNVDACRGGGNSLNGKGQ